MSLFLKPAVGVAWGEVGEGSTGVGEGSAVGEGATVTV